jgi:hypothetical protein
MLLGQPRIDLHGWLAVPIMLLPTHAAGKVGRLTDLETRVLEPLDNPFGPRLSPM